MYEMLRNMEPPVGFGKKCPYKLAYRVSEDLMYIAFLDIFIFSVIITLSNVFSRTNCSNEILKLTKL